MLDAINLKKTLAGRDIVADVSLRVDRGEVVALLGRGGSGKTTVFTMIAGIARPTGGAISLDGEAMNDMPMFERARRGVSYLPQEPSLFPSLTVEKNILFVLETRMDDAQQRRQFLDKLLRIFDIERLRKMPAAKLSGGERRRTEIARLLAMDPRYILLDEPFAGVDPIALGEMRNLLRVITRLGIGVLITDHNVRETLGLVDRAYIIESGRVIVDGPVAEIVANAEVQRSYLGSNFRI
jgi:lipopolysaccharide export system ATP-binding protein